MRADTIPLIQSLLFDSLVIAFLIFGVLATIAGIGLILCRDQTFRLFAVMNRHISTRQALKSASISHDIGPAVQRYRRWVAAAFMAGAAYSLYSLITRFDVDLIAGIATAGKPALLTVFLVDCLRWLMIALSTFAFIIGIMLGFFPGTLRAIEARSNRWYSMRKATAPLEIPHEVLDKWVEAHPRVAGWGITIGALIVVVSSGIILFGK